MAQIKSKSWEHEEESNMYVVSSVTFSLFVPGNCIISLSTVYFLLLLFSDKTRFFIFIGFSLSKPLHYILFGEFTLTTNIYDVKRKTRRKKINNKLFHILLWSRVGFLVFFYLFQNFRIEASIKCQIQNPHLNSQSKLYT